MGKHIYALAIALSLSGCGAYEGATKSFAYKNAVEEELQKETGVKPTVSFNWVNGSYQYVQVTFPRVTDKPMQELASKVRASVIREFKATPKALVLGFALND
jgi:hypothetical protein